MESYGCPEPPAALYSHGVGSLMRQRAAGIVIVALFVVIVLVSLVTLVPRKIEVPAVHVVISGVPFPDSFQFSPDGRIFVNEKNTGDIRVIASNGTILPAPFAHLPAANQSEEQGLFGIALDPAFHTNGYVYVDWAYWNGTYMHVRITRFTDSANVGANPTDILDLTDPNQTLVTGHYGGYIKFGPDGKLYAIVGEFGEPLLAQNLTYYAGKILRMNSDGSVPVDNPFHGSLVYAYGLRNGFGMDFSPTGQIVATLAGPHCCDKIVFIHAGANYGWPFCGTDASPICQSPFENATYQWGKPTVTPTGIAYSTDPNILYFGEYNTGELEKLTLTSEGTVSRLESVGNLTNMTQVFPYPRTAVIAVERAPNGTMYFTKGNRLLKLTTPTASQLPFRLSIFLLLTVLTHAEIDRNLAQP
jgi:glucose/arabinose dehydrogenase